MCIEYFVAVRDISGRIKESLLCQSMGYSYKIKILTLSLLKIKKSNNIRIYILRLSHGRLREDLTL